MRFVERNPFTGPDLAARKLSAHPGTASKLEAAPPPDEERINVAAGGSGGDFRAGIERTIAQAKSPRGVTE